MAFAESFFHLMAGTSKDQVPVAQRFGQSFPKHHVLLCNCSPRFPQQKQTLGLPVKNNGEKKKKECEQAARKGAPQVPGGEAVKGGLGVTEQNPKEGLRRGLQHELQQL